MGDVILVKTQPRAGNQSAPGLEAGPAAQRGDLYVRQGMKGQVGGRAAGQGAVPVLSGMEA